MSKYFQNYNKSYSALRTLMVGILGEMQNKLYYYNLVDGELVKIPIPVYYSMTGSENFLSDIFIYGAEAQGKAKGDYEQVPRCVLELQNISVNSAEMTNRYVDITFQHNVGGVIKTFVSKAAFLPLILTFNATIVLSNVLEGLKAQEALLSKLYKVTVFNIDTGTYTTQASIQIPEDATLEKTTEWQLNQKKEFKLTFSIESRCEYPIFEGGITIADIDYYLSHISDEELQHLQEGSVITFDSDGKVYRSGYMVDSASSIIDKSIATTDDVPYRYDKYSKLNENGAMAIDNDRIKGVLSHTLPKESE